jgi:hypothetical protein
MRVSDSINGAGKIAMFAHARALENIKCALIFYTILKLGPLKHAVRVKLNIQSTFWITFILNLVLLYSLVLYANASRIIHGCLSKIAEYLAAIHERSKPSSHFNLLLSYGVLLNQGMR